MSRLNAAQISGIYEAVERHLLAARKQEEGCTDVCAAFFVPSRKVSYYTAFRIIMQKLISIMM